jgi:hypothetical protein
MSDFVVHRLPATLDDLADARHRAQVRKVVRDSLRPRLLSEGLRIADDDPARDLAASE